MSGERTEQPTARRREEARRKGQGVGRSHELAMGLTLGVGVMVLYGTLPGGALRIADSIRQAVQSMGDGRISDASLVSSFGQGIGMCVTLVLPLGVAVAIATIAANLVAGGLLFSVYAVRFDPGRLNPIKGFQNLFNRQVLVRLGIAAGKLAILAFVVWQVLVTEVPRIVLMTSSGTGEIAGILLDSIFKLGLSITVLLAVVALIDFVVQRRRAQGQMRMTKEEVKQEYREQEGDPLIRGARRRRARQMAFARMMEAVKTADVVVTNPTQIAVALKYDSLTMRAPHIVAKGQRLMAERIKAIARKHSVQVVEDKPLARALFPRPLGSEVPPHLYRAVAQLLVFVQQARFGVRARRTAPAQRPLYRQPRSSPA